jgi:hypothetical protein
MSNAAGRFWDELKKFSISLTLFVFLALGDIIFTMNFFSISIFAALSITSVISTVYAEDVLLIPNSLGDNVWAFSPLDGSLISNNFIPSDGHLSQPIEIVVTPFETLLISDEVANAIFEYSKSGTYLRTIVGPADGVSRAYGLEMVGDWIYFSTSITIGSKTIGQLNRVRYDGTEFGIWCVANSIISPRDIVYIGNGNFLVSDSGTAISGGEDIELVHDDCVVQSPTWHDSDGINGIDFPQHIHLRGDGSALVAGFSDPSGIFQYDLGTGIELSRFSGLVTIPRGVFQLDNGNILYAGGTRVMVIDVTLGTEITIVNQLTPAASFRWPTRVTLPLPCLADLNGDRSINGTDLTIVLSGWGTMSGDINGDGTTDGVDLASLLSRWGAICP